MNSRMLGLVAGSFIALGTSTRGADAPDKAGLYLIGDIGGNFLQKIAFDSLLGAPAPGSPSLAMNPGVRGTVGVGYNFVPTLGAEAELGFSYNESKAFIVGGIPGNGLLRLWTVPLTVGLTWRPMIPAPPKPSDNETLNSIENFFQRSRPYLGGGVGAEEVFANFDSVTPKGSLASGRDTVLTYFLKAGVRFPLSDRTELGVQYRFSGDPGFTIKQNKSQDIFAHTVSVAVRFQF